MYVNKAFQVDTVLLVHDIGGTLTIPIPKTMKNAKNNAINLGFFLFATTMSLEIYIVFINVSVR